MKQIYLDHAATSPMHPASAKVFADALGEHYGNPSSIHQTGRKARSVLDEARHALAISINAQDTEIIFTSGGTESDNLAIFGTSRAKDGRHIITSQAEHHAVLHACQELEKTGYDVTYLPVDEFGRVNPEDVKQALRDDTILVTLMLANNEIGTLQPVEEIGALLKETDITFHTDAVQAYGLLPIDVDRLNVDLLSVSAHKVNGPKGIGFLYQRKNTALKPLIYGGEQERKRRAGTENVPAIQAFASAVQIAQEMMEEKQQAFTNYKEVFRSAFEQNGIDFKENGINQLPHIFNVSLPGIDIESFLVNLDLSGVSASSGSACTAGSIDPSHVLVAMYGIDAPELRNSIRFSFGIGLDPSDITEAAEKTVQITKRLAHK